MAFLRNLFGTQNQTNQIHAGVIAKPVTISSRPLNDDECKDKLLSIIEVICRLEITDQTIERFSMPETPTAAKAAANPSELNNPADMTDLNESNNLADITDPNDITEQNELVTHCTFLIADLIKTNPEAINNQVDDGTTLLHWAVNRNSLEIVEYLLSVGADPLIKNSKGFSAIHTAIMLDRQICFSLLVWKGLIIPATPEQPPRIRAPFFPLMGYIDFILRYEFNMDLARILVAAQLNLKSSTEINLFLLIRYFDALLFNPTSFISSLPHDMARSYFPGYLSSPIPVKLPRVTVGELMTAIKYTFTNTAVNDIETIDRYFRENGRQALNDNIIKNRYGNLITPLHYAIECRNLVAFEKFLNEGANIEAKSIVIRTRNQTPLSHALEIYESASNHHSAMVVEVIAGIPLRIIKLLLDRGANISDPSVLTTLKDRLHKKLNLEKHRALVNLLKGKINSIDRNGETVLTNFISKPSVDRYVSLDAEQDINLHIFSHTIIRCLISVGADLYTPVNGVLPLLSALKLVTREKMNLKALKYLLSTDIIDTKDPIHSEILNQTWVNLFRNLKGDDAYNEDFLLIKNSLLAAGIDINYAVDGETALSLCLRRTNFKIIPIIKFLLDQPNINLHTRHPLFNMSLLEYVNSRHYQNAASTANQLTIARMINDVSVSQQNLSKCLKIAKELSNPQSYLSRLPLDAYTCVLFPMLVSNELTHEIAPSPDDRENLRKR